MLRWFRETAPIRRKLPLRFSLQAILVAPFAEPLLLATSGTLPASTAAELCGGALLLSICLGVVLRKAIADPYVATVVRMEGLAAGNLDAPIQFTNYVDCVGRLTKAMFTFRKTAQDNIEAAKTLAATTIAAEVERKRTEEAAIAQQAALVVNSIGTGLERLADGELTFRLSEALPAAYEKLRNDFNSALDKLQETMKAIAINTQGVTAGAGEITQASDDLSRRTEQQAASLEQTAAALDEITATVRRPPRARSKPARSSPTPRPTPNAPARSCAKPSAP